MKKIDPKELQKLHAKKFNYKRIITEKDLDTFGHVNNATYLEIYEEARWQLITEHGFGLKEIIEKQMGPVILDIKISFKKELSNREDVIIETRCSKLLKKLFVLEQNIIKNDGVIANTATFTFGFLNFKTRKLISPPAIWYKAIGFEV